MIKKGVELHSYFNSLIIDKGNKKYLQLSSISSANTNKTLDEKIQEWKTALT